MTRDRLTGALLAGGALAGPVFLTTALIEGARRPGYRALRHPVSSLAIGRRGRVQSVNFMVAGTLYSGAALGLARAARGADRGIAVPALVATAALGLIGAGVFTADPVSGYPPGTPDQATERTRTGVMHDLASAPAFLCLPAAAIVDATHSWRHGQRWWAVYSAKSAVVALASVVLASAGFGQQPRLVERAGLFQRIFVGASFGWVSARSARRLLEGRDQVGD